MADGKVVYKITGNNSEFNKTVKETEGLAEAGAKTITTAFLAIGAAAAAAMGAALSVGKEYEQSVAKVATLADTSVISISQLSDQMRELAVVSGQSASQIAEATYQAISGGVDTAEAVSFVATATKLAVGGFTDAATATDILTTAINAYGFEAEDAAKVSDVLLTTQNKGKTTVAELAANMGRVIPVAAAMNVKFEDLATVYAQLTKNGIGTAEATTYTKGVLNELGSASSKVAQILKQQTGKSFSDLMAAGYSLGDVMAILGEAVDNDTTAFSNLWSSQEAGIGALALLNSGAEDYNATLQAMAQSAGATEQAYSTMMDTVSGQASLFKSAVQDLGIELYNTFISDAIHTALSSLTSAVIWLKENLNNVIPAVVSLGAAIAVLAVSFKFQSIVDGVTTAIRAFNAALASNPIGVVVAAIAVLVTAFLSMKNAVTPLQEEINAYHDRLEEIAQANDAVRDSIKAANENFNKQTLEIEGTAKSATEMVDRLAELESKTSLTADEQSEWNELLFKLANSGIPGVTEAIDLQNGTIEGGTRALYENIDAWKAQALAQAHTEKYTALLQAQADAEWDVLKAEEARTDASRSLQSAQSNLNELLRLAWDLTGNYGASLEQTGIDLAVLTNGTNDNAEAAQGLINAIAEASTAVSAWESAVKDADKTISDSQKTLDDTQKAAERYADEYFASTQEVVTANADLEESLVSAEDVTENWAENMGALARRGLNDGLLAALEAAGPAAAGLVAVLVNMTDAQLSVLSLVCATNGTDATISLLTALHEADPQVQQWVDNIGILTERGLSDGLLAAIVAAGPEAAADVKTLVELSDNELAYIETVFADRGEAGVQEFIQAVKGKSTEASTATASVITEAKIAAQTAAQNNSLYGVGADYMLGMVNGFLSMQSSALAAVDTVCGSVISRTKAVMREKSPSKVAFEIGEFYTEGLALGIGDASKEAETSAEHVAAKISDAFKAYKPTVDYTEALSVEPIASISTVEHQFSNLGWGGLFSLPWDGLTANITLEVDGYTLAQVVVENIDDAAAYNLGGA